MQEMNDSFFPVVLEMFVYMHFEANVDWAAGKVYIHQVFMNSY